MLTPELTRAARALLDWSQSELADHANLTLSTIRDFETGRRALLRNNLAGIQLALENAGIVFETAPEAALPLPANNGDFRLTHYPSSQALDNS